MSSPKRRRTRTLSAPSTDRTLLGLGFDVSGFPGLVEGCLLGAVDAEVDEPASSLESASASSAQGGRQ
jgi:hypothetical protein